MCLAAVGAALPAAAAHKHVKHEELAAANWMQATKNRGHFRWLMVEVLRDQRPTDAFDRTLAAVVEGDCRIEYPREQSGSLVVCVGTGRILNVPPGHFEMDPLLAAARVRIKTRLGPIRVSWHARDGRALYESQESCTDSYGREGSGRGFGLFADARARGVVFGGRVGKGFRQDFTFLARGAMVTDCHPPYVSAIDWDRARAGDVVHVRTDLSS